MKYSEFGNWLNQELEKNNRKQADLYKALGLTSGGVSAWFTGRAAPSVDNLRKIAIYLGIPESEMLRRAGIATARPTKSPFLEFMEDAGEKLSEEEQIDIMDNVRAKLLRKQRSKDAAK